MPLRQRVLLAIPRCCGLHLGEAPRLGMPTWPACQSPQAFPAGLRATFSPPPSRERSPTPTRPRQCRSRLRVSYFRSSRLLLCLQRLQGLCTRRRSTLQTATWAGRSLPCTALESSCLSHPLSTDSSQSRPQWLPSALPHYQTLSHRTTLQGWPFSSSFRWREHALRVGNLPVPSTTQDSAGTRRRSLSC